MRRWCVSVSSARLLSIGWRSPMHVINLSSRMLYVQRGLPNTNTKSRVKNFLVSVHLHAVLSSLCEKMNLKLNQYRTKLLCKRTPATEGLRRWSLPTTGFFWLSVPYRVRTTQHASPNFPLSIFRPSSQSTLKPAPSARPLIDELPLEPSNPLAGRGSGKAGSFAGELRRGLCRR